MLKQLAAVCLIVVVTGCASAPSKELNDTGAADSSFVFGYIDATDAPFAHLTSFELYQSGGAQSQAKELRVDGSLFYMEGVQTGMYHFAMFSGKPNLSLIAPISTHIYQFTEYKPNAFHFGGGTTAFYQYKSNRPTPGVRIDKPGIYFLGAYKLKKLGFFNGNKFDIEPIQSPSEAEVLTQLLPHAQGTQWEERLRVHLAALNKKPKR